VRIHLRSDVPLAVLLSGGLDSSLIASLAQADLEEPLHTFAVGFGDAALDEVEHARAVAEAIGAEHHEVTVRPDVAADLPEIVRRLDERICVSDAVIDSLRPHFPAVSLRTIPNGIDAEFFSPDAPPLPRLAGKRNIIFHRAVRPAERPSST